LDDIYLTLSVPKLGIPPKLVIKVPVTVTGEKQSLPTGDLYVLK